MDWNFDNSYTQLPAHCYARVLPTAVPNPKLVIFNYELATLLGLDCEHVTEEELTAIGSGNSLPNGAYPIAQAYAGHQFGHFTTLGDGRAILLGEQLTPTGLRLDVQLKGAGVTPFSRSGDGRAALGPMLREYIISEAMHALGIPTTRSLAVVTTGASIRREITLPGAILTRIAASHIRVGTFEYLAARGDTATLRILADYTIQRHYAECSTATQPYIAFLEAVINRQADLIAKWLLVGFIHGVMNTDNMALAGETIDYGPCAFMDTYNPTTVFSSIDIQGRYAYNQQPLIAQWNLARFAETLLPLLHDNAHQALQLATEAVAKFPELFRNYWLAGMRRKLGLITVEATDVDLIESLLTWMLNTRADYTNTLRMLKAEPDISLSLAQQTDFTVWHQQWQARLARQPASLLTVTQLMQANNPAIIPRNHQVEAVLDAAQSGIWKPLTHLLQAIAKPYQDISAYAHYSIPPEPNGQLYQTFCGT